MATIPLVSVIIPTFNSGKVLETCLDSIQRQSYKNVELIVVDAFSKDNTQEVATRFNAKFYPLLVERSPARNFGAKQATGKFVLFIDSDMELTRNVVDECISLCTCRGVGAVIIPEESVGEGFLAKCKKLEKMMRSQEAYGEAPRFIGRDTFQSIGGYDEGLVLGEDFELAQRLRKSGVMIGRCRAIIKHREEDLSIRKIVTKLYYYGKTLPVYAKKEPLLALKTSSPIRFAKNLSLLKERPTYFTGLCALKLVEYAAYMTGAFVRVFSLAADE